MKKYFLKAAPLILFVSITFLFHYRLFFPLSIYTTPDYGRSDAIHLSLANKYYYSKELKQNRIPIWNDQIGTGFPTLGEGQTAVFFPPNIILFRLLPFVFAYNISIILSFFTAAFGTYLFARSLKLSKYSSIYAGSIFALGGFFMAHVQHHNLLQTASLVPWIFWAANGFLNTAKIKNLLALSLLTGLQIFSGFPQITFYTIFMILLFTLLKSAKNGLIKTSQKTAAVSLAIVLGLAISAIQILPTYEFLKASARTSNPTQILTQFPYKPKNALQIIKPFAYGSPKEGTYPHFAGAKWGIFWENTAYIGLLPTSLAVAVVLSQLVKKSSQKRTILIISSLLLISLMLALGASAPTHPVFSFPMFSIFRVPSRFLLFFQLFLAVLSAFYLEKIRRKVVFAVVIVIGLVDLFLTFGFYNPAENAAKWLSPTAASNWLKQNNYQRIITLGNAEEWNKTFLNKGWKDTNYYFFARNSLDPNSNLLFGINQARAYESIQTKRAALTDAVIEGSVNKKETEYIIPQKTSAFLSTIGVSHIVSTKEINESDYKKVFETEKNGETSFKIYESQTKPNQFALTKKYKVAKNVSELVSLAKDENFNFQEETLLEKLPTVETLDLKSHETKIAQQKPGFIKITASLDGSAILTIPSSYYPGWKAYDNQKKTKIFPANINSLGILLEKGQHEVVFKYQPKSLIYGSCISFASLLILLFLFYKFRNSKFA